MKENKCPASGDNFTDLGGKLEVVGRRKDGRQQNACPVCNKPVVIRRGPAGNYWLQIPTHSRLQRQP